MIAKHDSPVFQNCPGDPCNGVSSPFVVGVPKTIATGEKSGNNASITIRLTRKTMHNAPNEVLLESPGAYV
ncbi:hypothetical protein Aph01nite_66980 [Acrocarpospora phusangensis]|uniref:Uncharacterized protein n=1 Tax=Acrocarpospora phusangensis TaxID=1070424 RepID=A0A919QGI7_9ACTN|nr:hypothetical protein Aph01nite_66980 [Acrocarpospora phusangensis]